MLAFFDILAMNKLLLDLAKKDCNLVSIKLLYDASNS